MNERYYNKIKFKLNGDSTINCEILIDIADKDIFKKVLKVVNHKMKINLDNAQNIRLFNQEGLEIYEEDIKFLSNKDTIYVSKGEEFNVNTYYSEYNILKILGQGGFGKVYLANHKITNDKVAIKMTNAGGISSTDEIESIFSEAETVKALNHPNIVKILNFFVIKKTLQTYFIMEYLEGGELLKYLEEKKRLTEPEALEIFK